MARFFLRGLEEQQQQQQYTKQQHRRQALATIKHHQDQCNPSMVAGTFTPVYGTSQPALALEMFRKVSFMLEPKTGTGLGPVGEISTPGAMVTCPSVSGCNSSGGWNSLPVFVEAFFEFIGGQTFGPLTAKISEGTSPFLFSSACSVINQQPLLSV